MAEDYTKSRSVANPHMGYKGMGGRGSSKKGYGGMQPYGYNRDMYQRMPKGEIKELKDNTHSPYLYEIKTDTQKYDLDRMRYDSVGMKGYSRKAFEYDY